MNMKAKKTLFVLAIFVLIGFGFGQVKTAEESSGNSSPAPEQVIYEKINSTELLTDGADLIARVDGQSHILISKKEEICWRITEQKDFDADGYADVLIEHVNGCGGNCCADSYFIYSYRGQGRFIKSEEFGESWTGPEVEKWNSKWSILLTSNNEGVNTDDFKEITERYVFEKGKIVRVAAQKPKELKALVEMRAKQFDIKNENQIKTLLFDLDGDTKKDKIIGKLWSRWGRIMWTVKFANGKMYENEDHAGKRIGVLASKTNGVNDLVCDLDGVLTWNGKEYKEKIEPEKQTTKEKNPRQTDSKKK